MLAKMHLLIVFAIITFVWGHLELRQSQGCGDTYALCAPPNAVTSSLPSVGPELSTLYPDLILVINSESRKDLEFQPTAVRHLAGAPETIFCCAQTSQCLLLPRFEIPFCWDRFTTNYYFPDGSYGSMVAGNYTSSSGIQVNLIYGNWESPSGMTGNIYSNLTTAMPNTSTMPMPTPWTSSGIGSAIPASQLGIQATTTGTIDANSTMTISAITLDSTTITIGTSACHRCNITIIPGLTGLPPSTTMTTSGNGTLVPAITTENNTSAPTSSRSIIPATIINHAEPVFWTASMNSMSIIVAIAVFMSGLYH